MRRRGFSMVELIVVMGIVALLAALLFPILVATKAKAKETVCMSNLKQLGLAELMYQEDQGGLPFSESETMSGYLGHAKLRCPQRMGDLAYNFNVYNNLGSFDGPAQMPTLQRFHDAVRECYALRGPEFPLLADKNHMPKVWRDDDLLYGTVLVFRLGGAVQRVSKIRAVHIVLAQVGLDDGRDLPCKVEAQDANL